MLTFGWAFSFLDRIVEPQGDLRAPGEEPGISGNTRRARHRSQRAPQLSM
jgi:hypothetical protein